MAAMSEAELILKNVKDSLEELDKMEHHSMLRNKNLLLQLNNLEEMLNESSLKTMHLKDMREKARADARSMENFRSPTLFKMHGYKIHPKEQAPTVGSQAFKLPYGSSGTKLPGRNEVTMDDGPRSKRFLPSGKSKFGSLTFPSQNLKLLGETGRLKNAGVSLKLEDSVQTLLRNYSTSTYPKVSTPAYKKVKKSSEFTSSLQSISPILKQLTSQIGDHAVSGTSDAIHDPQRSDSGMASLPSLSASADLSKNVTKPPTLIIPASSNQPVFKESINRNEVFMETNDNSAQHPAVNRPGKSMGEAHIRWTTNLHKDLMEESKETSDATSKIILSTTSVSINNIPSSVETGLEIFMPNAELHNQHSQISEEDSVQFVSTDSDEIHSHKPVELMTMDSKDQRNLDETISEEPEPSLVLALPETEDENDCKQDPGHTGQLSDEIQQECTLANSETPKGIESNPSTVINEGHGNGHPVALPINTKFEDEDTLPKVYSQNTTDSDKLASTDSCKPGDKDLESGVLQRCSTEVPDMDICPYNQAVDISTERPLDHQDNDHSPKHADITTPSTHHGSQEKPEGILQFLSSDDHDDDDDDSIFDFAKPSVPGFEEKVVQQWKTPAASSISQKSNEASDDEDGDIEQQLAHIIAHPAPSRNSAQKESESEAQTTVMVTKEIAAVPRLSSEDSAAKPSIIQEPEKKSVTHHLAEKLALHLGLNSPDDANVSQPEKEQEEDDFDFYD